ncbi:cytochrome P450 [Streptomyces sp. AK02-04a]|uniref:cytochrome P450 n=1 Tax=Streptomyces sp. AK02-04a TaxID=3028649 RepID=UPI00299FE793|nr:cytochrome P450 [Streptomyces sp. AK02-04a]MDX3763345.1 cytochrome P450 [Streptomyces sp. AK02-04a]
MAAAGFSWADPAVAAAREQYGAARTPLGPLVLRYAQSAELLRDPRLTTSYRYSLERAGITSGPAYDFLTASLLCKIGRERRRLHRQALRASTQHVITELRPLIRATAQHLAGQLAITGEACDFMTVFADPLLKAVTCRLFGVPAQDVDRLHHLFRNDDAGLLFMHDRAQIPRIQGFLTELTDCTESLISHHRAHPGDDPICGLIHTQHDGLLSEEELHSVVHALLLAIWDNPFNQLRLALTAFAQHPEQWRLLQQHPELAAQAVEEVLRWCPPAALIIRHATEEFTYQGLHIPAGSHVFLGVHAAQRDPRAFAHADTFDITAEQSAPLLLFGGGTTACTGTALTRATLTEALTALTSSLGPPQITDHTARQPTTHSTPPLLLRFGWSEI